MNTSTNDQPTATASKSRCQLLLNVLLALDLAGILITTYLILTPTGNSVWEQACERWTDLKRHWRGATETIPAGWNGVNFSFDFAEQSKEIPFVHPELKLRLGKFLAEAKAEHNLTGLDHLGVYADRCVAGTSTLSAHAYGKAIDIEGFRFGDGSRLAVSEHSDLDKSERLRKLDALLRKHFDVVLNWDTNEQHSNHFHAEVR